MKKVRTYVLYHSLKGKGGGFVVDFTHLHVNTEYSLLKGAAKIDALVNQAKKLGYSSLAITDQNAMYGVIPFYQACKQAGIKPIIGLELSIIDDNNSESRLILLAKTSKGYTNLVKLCSIAHVLPAGQQPIVEKKYLHSYKDDLIAICSAYKGEIQYQLLQNNQYGAIQALNQYTTIFGDDFYIGLHDHNIAEEKEVNLKVIKFAQENKVKLVATNQVMYVNKEDALAHKCLLAIGEGTTLRELNSEFLTEEFYLKPMEDMKELFFNLPNALANTIEVARQCNVEFSFDQYTLPSYPLPSEENSKDYLRKLCFKGMKERYSKITNEIEARLDYELKIIDQMKFNDYFLIVWDFMDYAHKRKILTGPGRGSAAGSLVAYVLKITNVDPIKYDLLFERFLNPERISMPDIDIDFPDIRREEVIDYVYKKYGKNHVAQIITFGTLAAKAALRDVGKVIGIPLKEIDRVAKLISSRPNLTIDIAVNESPILTKLIEEHEHIKEWIMLAKRVEGIPRHVSTHAAGVVMSSDPLTDKVPLQKGHLDVLLTQYPMNVLEDLGLLKMDFLGLRNLSFIEEILQHVSQMENETININEISYTDERTFQLLGSGETTGIFQLESPGMRRVLKKLKPTEFEDIVAVNALYRPGPMENIPLYIAGKHKERKVSYVHPDLIPILEKTYGVIVYQEQIMQIASKLAGFSLGEADILRRAVSKKKREVLEEQRSRFVQGCIQNGYTKPVADEVYDLIVRFANYGFNRSHSVAYSMISYQLGFLKANYPTAFFAAVFTSAIGLHQKLNEYISDAKRRKITVLPPSINKSLATFTVNESGEIQFGLAAIKNVGYRAIDEIVHERAENGPYSDIFDFCARVNLRLINRRTLEAFVTAGAFDEFKHHRAGLLATLDYALEYGEQVKKLKEDKQTTLFVEDIEKPKVVEVPPFKEKEKLYFEKEALGFYLSSHPIEEYSQILESYGCLSIVNAKEAASGPTRIAGLIEKVRMIKTKKGEQMAFIRISDDSGELDVTAFPKIYRQFFSVLQEGQLLFLEGKMETTEERSQLIVMKATDPQKINRKVVEKKCYLKISHDQMSQPLLTQVKGILKKNPGNVMVILFYEENKQTIQLSDDFNISASNQCLEELKQVLGEKNVVLKH